MTFNRAAEMFTEAIPGVLIQLTAILADGQTSTIVIASLMTSALTTGFTSASISYDFDTDPSKRRDNPDFFGYAPDGSKQRTVLFGTMLLLSTVMLLVRALVLVLLGMVSRSIALLYIGVDLGLFLLFKILRDDFFYWLQVPPAIEIFGAVLVRVIVKVISDFTLCVQFRHPNE